MRSSGILLHISSLSSPYGIGTFGKEAYQFVDFLKEAGQRYWQVLPLGPTSYGDSPYQTFSAFAGNPYFIDLDFLVKDGLLAKEELAHLEKKDGEPVDYEFLYYHRFLVLKKAFDRFLSSTVQEEFASFCIKHDSWLGDYALFMAIKNSMPEGNWLGWDEALKKKDRVAIAQFEQEHEKDIRFWKFLQYLFYTQWLALKRYANQHGVLIIGDMPIYVAFDSSDVWGNPDYFELDETLKPKAVAGVPPDAFTETGQLWGNPLYRYDVMKNEGYRWWIKRIEESLALFDVVRIDHFRGFEAYYSVPYGDTTAVRGTWIKGPGALLFQKVKDALGEVSIIAEDLGFLTQEVYDMLKECGFPGMKILQFGFDPNGDSEHAPHNHTLNTIVYPGTHDNPTLKQWATTLDKRSLDYILEYLSLTNMEELPDRIIQEALKSTASIAIVSMQDYLGLGKEARMNTPSTLGGNWVWRMKKDDLTANLAHKIRTYTTCYRRLAQ